jgi:ferritin-like metal-binding protein YciE
MEGLIEEAKEILGEDEYEDVLDAGLIAAAQKVEHYEMAAYGCLKTYAGLLGNQRAEQLLEETLSEEKRADDLLTQIAERSINVEAMEAGTGRDEGTGRGGSTKRGSNR